VRQWDDYIAKKISLPDGREVTARCWNIYSRDSNGYSWDCFYGSRWYGIKSDPNTSDRIEYGPTPVRGPFVQKRMVLTLPNLGSDYYPYAGRYKIVNASCLKNQEGFHSPYSCYYKGEWYWMEEKGSGHLQK